jgi:hypothetical protein
MEEGVFKVNFPSKNELVRVQHFGRFYVPNSTIILSFHFWKKEVQPAFVPEDVWVRVYGLPPVALDDYLALWALGDVFGKTLDIDISYTRHHNVLHMLITCLDTNLIPESWDLKIKHKFFRLRFEVEGEQVMNNMDVSTSEAPGDGGDDDTHSNTHDKSGGADPERNVKRTKNDGELNEEKGDSKSPQKSNTKTVAMHMTRHATAAGLEKNSMVIPKSKDAPRYDDAFLGSDKICIRPKRLFHSFNAVMDDFSESAPVKDHGMVYVPQLVITDGEDRSTSIASVHGARASRHTGADRAATDAAVPSPRPSGPAAATDGPAIPWATTTPVTPSRPVAATPCVPNALVGSFDLPRPGMHGLASHMLPATSIKSMTINRTNPPLSPMQDKVNVVQKMPVLISSGHKSSQRSMSVKQGVCTQG